MYVSIFKPSSGHSDHSTSTRSLDSQAIEQALDDLDFQTIERASGFPLDLCLDSQAIEQAPN